MLAPQKKTKSSPRRESNFLVEKSINYQNTFVNAQPVIKIILGNEMATLPFFLKENYNETDEFRRTSQTLSRR